MVQFGQQVMQYIMVMEDNKMLTKNEHIFIILTWSICFVIYYFFLLKDKINIHEGLIISFMIMGILKSIYDIKYKTGNQKMYIYSEKTNQILRYLVLIVLLIFTFFYHFILFSSKI